MHRLRLRGKEALVAPFRVENKVSKILIMIFVLFNGIVLFNAIFHPPSNIYDSTDHYRYVWNLGGNLRLPSARETYEFFSPPLPYLFPSLLHVLSAGKFWVAKSAQLQNVLFSIGLAIYMLKLCDLIYPNDVRFKALSLSFLAMLPVYYKMFTFFRGEPLLAFLSTVVAYKALSVFLNCRFRPIESVGLGISLGLLILARQWGFGFFPAIAVFVLCLMVKYRQKMWLYLRTMMISFAIAFLVGGWFYIHLYLNYGSMQAFNRPRAPGFAFSNQPAKFYIGLGLNKLFTEPLRPNLHDQFLPVFYSDVWGDYWCYFLVYERDGGGEKGAGCPVGASPSRTNRDRMAPYLGRAMAISLLPSSIFVGGLLLGAVFFGRFLWNRALDRKSAIYSALYLAITFTLASYCYFLIMYPHVGKGDTIKAGYMLNIMPLASILAAEFLLQIKRKWGYGYRLICIALLIPVLHNLPLFISRHASWPLGIGNQLY